MTKHIKRLSEKLYFQHSWLERSWTTELFILALTHLYCDHTHETPWNTSKHNPLLTERSFGTRPLHRFSSMSRGPLDPAGHPALTHGCARPLRPAGGSDGHRDRGCDGPPRRSPVYSPHRVEGDGWDGSGAEAQGHCSGERTRWSGGEKRCRERV